MTTAQDGASESSPSTTSPATGHLASMSRAVVVGVALALVSQIVLLVVAGWHNRRLINPDAVSYMRIASYYVNGQTDLMVSGYWGPMMSWLIAPLLGIVAEPVDAARIVMGLSAALFLLGCVSVFRSFQLGPIEILLGTWVAAITSVIWSVKVLTPDLLLSGLMFFAVSRMVSPQWIQNRRFQFATGLIWGAAYLTKAVALPVALGMGIGIGTLWVITRSGSFGVVLRSLGVTLLGLLLLAAPWIITLSWKYESFVFSTTAKIAHAMIGPPDVDRNDPMIVYLPEPGRLWWGEDTPPDLYRERYWSPLASLSYAKHQLKVIYSNTKGVFHHLTGFDHIRLGLFATLFGLLVHVPWRENMRAGRWRWAGVPISCACAAYLPVYARDERYYYPAYPFLIVAGMGMVMWLTRSVRGRINLPRVIGIGLVTLSFAYPSLVMLPKALRGLDDPRTTYAYDLAKRLQAANVSGPMVGAGGYDSLWGGYSAGVYLAFYMNEPYLGNEAQPTAESFKRTDAKLIIIDRQLPLNAELEQDPAFQNLDGVLFGSQDEAGKYPLKVYRMSNS